MEIHIAFWHIKHPSGCFFMLKNKININKRWGLCERTRREKDYINLQKNKPRDAAFQKGCHGANHLGKLTQGELFEHAGRRLGISAEECEWRVRRKMGYDV